MAGYDQLNDGATGLVQRTKINTQFSELFTENTKATITVADAAALAAIPAEYIATGKRALQLDTKVWYRWSGAAWVLETDLDISVASLDVSGATTINPAFTGMLKCTAGVISVAVDGTDYIKPSYGEMYCYENATVLPIDVVNSYHPVRFLSAGSSLKNFTFDAGSTGAVASVADAGGGKITITSNAHGLLAGEVVVFSNSTDYDGAYIVESPALNTFVVTKAFVATRAFNWYQPSRLIAGAGSDGEYHAVFSCSASSSGNLKVFKFEFWVNTTARDQTAAERKYSTGGDLTPLAAGGIGAVTAGDQIYMMVADLTDATDITIKHCNLQLHRV